ncbi:dynein regulatory complex protein 11-like [Plodia interpunctella]|uniref:dynein regulatory complex protein 11-like n=1 Tax=Plodia interpunctella TaxID=58824 RepID=UPI002368EEF8|nr:dynein regulatory complex protein 11-like [Plodia interpunctella]
MSSKDYYKSWLKLKEQMNTAFAEDARLQELAILEKGLKPQGTAVEVVSRVYNKYCDIYNKLCDCYDMMAQVQRRTYIKKIIDAITCRILELKLTLQEVEVFEYTYPDNALQQLIMIPQDIEVLCPFFYPFEVRSQEMQFIVDQIFAGNRIGDPSPTPSEIERREEQRLEEENRMREEREAEIKRKLAMGEDIPLSEASIVYTAEELEEMRKLEEYNGHINNIQRMERSRRKVRERVHKMNELHNTYIELAGLKAPPAREELKIRAAKVIQYAYRLFMKLKRDNVKELKRKTIMGMIMPSWSPPSAKLQLEKVKEERRNIRRKYFEKFLAEKLKEDARVFKLREGDIMDDITAEINDWLREWYKEVKIFDEFPYPEEGGSILIVRGDTMTVEEYIVWREAEDKRLKAQAGAKKTKEQIKAEKKYEEEERKRIAQEAKEKEAKRMLDYKKSRHNPDFDPGIYLYKGNTLDRLQEAWFDYQDQWKSIDIADAPVDAIKGYILQLIIENAYQSAQFELRPIVDEVMRLELKLLNKSCKNDWLKGGVAKPPTSQKRVRPKPPKPPNPEKFKPERMFQELVDKGIIKKYPHKTLDDFWGERNYAAADMRAVLWTPSFPLPCLGDVKELVRTRCILTIGCSCPNAVRSQLFVGPSGSGKRTLIYAVATETNSILIDLSPMNVSKYPKKRLKRLFQFVGRISKLMQPTVIMVHQADKLFYKKVPKEEKKSDPTKLKRAFYKEVVKPIGAEDKILVLGTATEPWVSKAKQMYKAFPSVIMIPRSDYGSLSFILSKMLLAYPGVARDFNVQSLAQILRGYDLRSVIKCVNAVMTPERVAMLYYKPLHPMEILDEIIECEEAVCTDDEDYEMYMNWYRSYTKWGAKYFEYMAMLESQLRYKLKKDEKENKNE